MSSVRSRDGRLDSFRYSVDVGLDAGVVRGKNT